MTDYQVITRELEIAATPTEIAAWISDFRRWVTWSPWEELDPNLSRTYSGPESGIGAHYAWSGNKKAGQGTMEITAVEPNAIKIDLTFLKPFKSASKTEFEFVDTEVGTRPPDARGQLHVGTLQDPNPLSHGRFGHDIPGDHTLLDE